MKVTFKSLQLTQRFYMKQTKLKAINIFLKASNKNYSQQNEGLIYFIYKKLLIEITFNLLPKT